MLTQYASSLDVNVLRRLGQAREETDKLFDVLRPGVLYARPIPERHRIVFYIGHLEAFDWNLLRNHLDLAPFHPEFDGLFAFGIDPVDGGLPNDQPMDWPLLAEIEGYRDQIRRRLDSAFANTDNTETLIELMNIAIEHRLMHAETLEYMFHQLPYDSKVAVGSPTSRTRPSFTAQMVSVPAGTVTLGLRRSSDQFGWDNEFESHTVDVPAFSVDKYKVTNGQYELFVKDGGYTRRSLWSSADWEWKTESNVWHPAFWIPKEDNFAYRSMFCEGEFPPDSPVYVSHAEACAYSRWAGKELPTEAEWQRAAEGALAPAKTRTDWNPPAIGAHPEFRSDYGVEDLLGTGWEWTSTSFAPFPGFAAHPSYVGYSAPFFDGRHFVMKGGSHRTAACLLRKSFRNWFQSHYQYVYAGFRCVSY
jgi:iron(II)-dependent oxidoreductase